MATDCSEYESACKIFIDNGKIPPQVLDFWMMGDKNSIEEFNLTFMNYIRTQLEKHLEASPPTCTPPDKVCVESLLGAKTLKSRKTWKMATKEKENKGKLSEFFPHVVCDVDNTIHSLFCQMSFDYPAWKEKGEFCLHVCVQPPVNNRDIDSTEITNPNFEEGNQNYKRLEYVAHVPGTEDDENDRFKNTSGHYVLLKRLRREACPKKNHSGSLSVYTHMRKRQITSTDDENSPVENQEIITVGDHVALTCDWKSIQDLFTLLTVSLNAFKNSKIHFSILSLTMLLTSGKED